MTITVDPKRVLSESDRGTAGCQASCSALLNSHGLVLLYVALDANVTLREISERLELTERRVVDIIRHLTNEGFLNVDRIGRRNHYRVNREARFRHPVLSDIPFYQFVELWRNRGLDRS